MSNMPAPKKRINPNVCYIDSRAATFEGEAIRIMAATIVSTGQIKLSKMDVWGEKVIAKPSTLVVTDTPQVFSHWGLSFSERNMSEVLASYKMAKAANLVKLEGELERFNVDHVVQTMRVDENGKKLDIDAEMENGHLAVLMAVWAARKTHGGYIITPHDEPAERRNLNQDDNDDDGFSGILPFTI